MIKSIEDLELKDKRVFVRVDFNVPLDAMVPLPMIRINAALPTIRKLSESGAKVVLASHLGRPKGEKVPTMSLAPVARHLPADWSSCSFLGRLCGRKIENAVNSMVPGQIALLENLRFTAETDNDPVLPSLLQNWLMSMSMMHLVLPTAHASTHGVAELILTVPQVI